MRCMHLYALNYQPFRAQSCKTIDADLFHTTPFCHPPSSSSPLLFSKEGRVGHEFALRKDWNIVFHCSLYSMYLSKWHYLSWHELFSPYSRLLKGGRETIIIMGRKPSVNSCNPINMMCHALILKAKLLQYPVRKHHWSAAP